MLHNNALYWPIPLLKDVDGWKKLPIIECGEPLVPIGPFSRYPHIATSAIYAGERQDSPYAYGQLDGALLTTFVRQGVAEHLAQVAFRLPPRHMPLVLDAYRPLSVQRALFLYYCDVLIKRGIPGDQALEEAQQFVSIPSEDPTCPPPHNTGGAVDLTIIRFDAGYWKELMRLNQDIRQFDPSFSENWEYLYQAELKRSWLIREASVPLAMGTVFDAVQPKTATRFYERLPVDHLTPVISEIRNNRRMFYNTMASAGFSNYSEEWWHFDGGNQFAMARTGRQAIYGATTLSAENKRHEQMYRAWYGTLADDKRITKHPQAVAL
ncbi:MAG: M15 family metallopeptidase [bacterium]|nr:M15 family metallopeptidase [bacterium]